MINDLHQIQMNIQYLKPIFQKSAAIAQTLSYHISYEIIKPTCINESKVNAEYIGV